MLIRCPGCDKTVKVAEGDRKTVRCPACDRKIILDEMEEEEEDERPAKERERRSARESPSRPSREKARKSRNRQIVGLVPLLVVGPVGILFLALAPFFAWATAGAILLSIPLAITGFIKVFNLCKKAGLQQEVDAAGREYEGGAAVLALQIGYAFQRPRLFGSWVAMQVLGMVLMIEGLVLAVVLKVHDQVPNGSNNQPSAEDKVARALTDLDDPKPEVREAAANELSVNAPNQRQAEVARKLAGLLQAPEGRPIPYIKALRVWGTANEVPALITCLGHKEIFVRWETLQAIGRFKDERALAPVVESLQDLHCLGHAQKALIEMGPMAEKGVIPLLGHTNDTIRISALDILKEIGTQQSVPALQAVVASNNIFLANRARDALQAIAGRKK